MNAKEKDLVMVFLNFICLSKGFLNAEEKYYTNTMNAEEKYYTNTIDSGAAPEKMF